MLKPILIIILPFFVLLIQAQTDSSTIYRGLGGEYTFDDFKSWSDSVKCKEKPYVLEVRGERTFRKITQDEAGLTKLFKAFPVFIQVGEPEKNLKYPGYLRIYEGGAHIYILAKESDKENWMQLPLETTVYCATPKQSLKANQTELRFLVERDSEELDASLREYLKANSLILLTSDCKDVIDCNNPHKVKVSL
jgi:hypothetical protein